MTNHILAPALFALGLTMPGSQAATVVAGPISNLGTDFFINATTTGGGDTTPSATSVFSRDLETVGAFNVGAGGSTVSITGFGFAAAGNAIAATQATITITYLGLNGAFGGGDDVIFGSRTNSVTGFATGSTYYWNFDTPLTQTIDAENSIFRFEITSNGTGNFSFKTTSGTAISAAKFSVAGTSVAAVPEPSAALLGGLGLLGLLRRRR